MRGRGGASSEGFALPRSPVSSPPRDHLWETRRHSPLAYRRYGMYGSSSASGSPSRWRSDEPGPVSSLDPLDLLETDSDEETKLTPTGRPSSYNRNRFSSSSPATSDGGTPTDPREHLRRVRDVSSTYKEEAENTRARLERQIAKLR
jgi:hypothetical protein